MPKPFFHSTLLYRILRVKTREVRNFRTSIFSCYVSGLKKHVKKLFQKITASGFWPHSYKIISNVILILAALKVAGIIVDLAGFYCPTTFGTMSRILTVSSRVIAKVWSISGAKFYTKLQALEKLLKAVSKVTEKAKSKL